MNDSAIHPDPDEAAEWERLMMALPGCGEGPDFAALQRAEMEAMRLPPEPLAPEGEAE